MVTVEQDQETLVELRQKKRVIGELIGAQNIFIFMPSHLDNPDEALQPTQARQIKLLLEFFGGFFGDIFKTLFNPFCTPEVVSFSASACLYS